MESLDIWSTNINQKIDKKMNEYRYEYCKTKTTDDCDFDELVRFIADGATSGLLNSRARFDVLGALFFSATVISTIGFGTSTPRTQMGRLITIIYGVVGCTCCVLFFNLFLERLVTGMSYILRSLRERKIRYRLKASGNKPVTLLINNEDFNESSRFLNFCILTLGACFFYCLSNVSSIVVRQLLNWMIKKMDVKVEDRSFLCFRKKRRYMGLGLRPPKGYDMTSERSSVDYADGLLSLKEFLMNNQSSMIMLQKQLIKSAMKNVVENEEQKISATRVGPMGILDEAFGDEN
uniref:Ion_trans_2 domain-containing protein n=1 Tax=Caenorhabditis japonica TaxID=281687 RepID=A0A8R1DQ30_CAEJA